MRATTLSSLLLPCLVVPGLTAQANVVAGLDGRLSNVDNLTYYGRRGAGHPNGEVGMAMLNTMCNPGSVDIPWYAAMQAAHPFFGFLVVRVANDRIEQINEWSYCKHAWLSVNVNGACGSCQNPGTGSLMGVNCSDTYGAGNNANRHDLAPPGEIDPWLGTWQPVGSYFDIGDPNQPGFPAPADGIRSLDTSIFTSDDVEHRVTVDESDLLTPNAQYYYGLQLVIGTESVQNRDDNLAHRGFAPSWNGSQWSFANTAPQQYGSILDRWTGATVESGQNGNDDGRFFVASKVTPLGGGVHHYEYAVHNVDNSRGGGTFRVPVDAGATATNFTFGDIDSDASNDWTAQRVGNELVFTSPLDNPLEWNTIYNFGFDVDFAPAAGVCQIDQARVGPGNLWVEVPTAVPAAGSFATVTAVGTGCGGSAVACDGAFYETPGFDLANSSFTLDYHNGAYTLVPGAGSWIAPTGTVLPLGDDTDTTRTTAHTIDYPGGSTTALTICSNGFLSDGSNGTAWDPSVSAFLSGDARWSPMWHDLSPNQGGDVWFDSNSNRTVVTWDNVENYTGSLTATFQIQFWANGDVHVIYQSVGVAGNDYLVGFSMGGGAADPGNVDISQSLTAGLAICNAVTIPHVGLSASARPVLGTTIDLDTFDVPAGTWFGLSILSLGELNPALDLTFLGMPGCHLYQPLDVIDQFPTAGSSGSRSFTFPNTPSLAGTVLLNQSATLSPGITPFGFAMSNALRLTVGIY